MIEDLDEGVGGRGGLFFVFEDVVWCMRFVSIG